jgi:tetratricopeptide (TPR) repeat protein
MAKRFFLAAVLFVSACTGVRSVQVQPPVTVPPGLITGYGVEKISGNPERARKAAYLRAMDDLLTRSGPVLVSKTVQDQTTVIDARSANRTLESTFRLRASRMLQPSFEQSGMEHGFMWVLLATTEAEIESGWQQFVVWRAERIAQAQKLFEEANGPERVQLLRASLSLLEDAGAADDPGMLYYRVKAALDGETARIARFEKFQKDFRTLADSGELDAAEIALEEALRGGLDQPTYQRCSHELSERRDTALQIIREGDDLFQEEQYKQARGRYEQARKIDRNNSVAAGKIEMADRFEREARARKVRATIGFVIPVAVQTLGEYFEFKREEEARKREEESRKREEAERAAEEERRRREQESARPRRPPNRPDRPQQRPHP